MSPITLRSSPSGVAAMMVSPPRAEKGECQPGRKRNSAAKALKLRREQARPIFPTFPARRGRCPVWGLVSSVMDCFSELDFDGLADGFQRLQVEVHFDSDFLAGLVFRYSP